MGREGLRSIVVDGRLLRWRFNDVLVVIPGELSGPQLYVDWGWRDWLDKDGPGAEPHVVTPRFVAEAVRFAATRGWPSAADGRPLRLGFRNGRFTLVEEDASPGTSPGRDAARG
jgi:hypothetical protein